MDEIIRFEGFWHESNAKMLKIIDSGHFGSKSIEMVSETAFSDQMAQICYSVIFVLLKWS